MRHAYSDGPYVADVPISARLDNALILHISSVIRAGGPVVMVPGARSQSLTGLGYQLLDKHLIFIIFSGKRNMLYL